MCADVGSFQDATLNRRNSPDPRCDNLGHVLLGLNDLDANPSEDNDPSSTKEHIFGVINGLDYICRCMKTLHNKFFDILNPTPAKTASILTLSKEVLRSPQQIKTDPSFMDWDVGKRVTAHLAGLVLLSLPDQMKYELIIEYFQYLSDSDSSTRIGRGGDIGRHVLSRIFFNNLFQRAATIGMFVFICIRYIYVRHIYKSYIYYVIIVCFD